MRSKKVKRCVVGKAQLLRDFEAAQKNFEVCEAEKQEFPLSALAREEGRTISDISVKFEEYYKLLKQKLVDGYVQTEDSLGLERSVSLLVQEYEDIIAQLEAGKKAHTSFEGQKLERYAMSKLCENFFLREKMTLCEIAYNAVQIEERTNENGQFSKVGSHVTAEQYIQSMIDLDAKLALAIQDDHVLAENAVIYEKILSEGTLDLTASSENA